MRANNQRRHFSINEREINASSIGRQCADVGKQKRKSRDMNATSIQQFRAYALQFVLSISGGGSRFIADYLEIPGASATFLEAVVPYATTATDDFLGFKPENYCSEKTARLLASQARTRAKELAKRRTETGNPINDSDIIGIGTTAALVSDRPKRGPHRVYCATRSRNGMFSAKLDLQKGARTRVEEERIAADFILSTALFVAKHLNDPEMEPWKEHCDELELITDARLFPEDRATIAWATLDEKGANLLDDNQELTAMLWNNGVIDRVGSKIDAKQEKLTIYPGSFNPPHEGHAEIVEIAQEKTQNNVELEISVKNVDKPPIDPLELVRRLKIINEKLPGIKVWTTNAPRYVQKAELFPGAQFVMGADTAVRLANPKYAENSLEKRNDVLKRLNALDVDFCVFARKINQNIIGEKILKEELPDLLKNICVFVSEKEFLNDASSSALRDATSQNDPT